MNRHRRSKLGFTLMELLLVLVIMDGLKALRVKPEGVEKWNGPYLKKDLPADPWGNAYVYRAPGRSGGYEIVSYGADGREGGEGENADITSWEAK